MGAAYEAAKAGGKHKGFLRIYQELPDHLIEKAIRSLAARASEHRAWIADPALKVRVELSDAERARLVAVVWPKEVRGFEEQISILEDVLRDRQQEK